MTLLRVVTAMVGIALTGIAQNQRPSDNAAGSGWRTGPCESLVVKRIFEDRKKIDAKMGIDRTKPSATDVENEDAVPVLLKRVHEEFGDSEPHAWTAPQANLIGALRAITNTDQGFSYSRWTAWWEANRQFPRQKWILDGFASRGLHAVDPVDDRFGLELIGVLGDRVSTYHFNASRLIASASPADQARWIELAADSADRNLRLGAVTLMSQLDQSRRQELFRKLAGDPDLEVRRNSLTALNRDLRKSLSTPPNFCRIEFVGHDTREISSIAFAGDLLIVAYAGNARAFDPRTRREAWTRPIPPAIGEFLLGTEGEVLFASSGGALLAFDLRGNILWRRARDSQHWTNDNTNEVKDLVQYGKDVLVVREHTLERIDRRTGVRKATYRGAPWIFGAAASKDAACFVDERGLHCLDGREKEFSAGKGIAMSAQTICVADEKSQGHSYLACLDARTLSELWFTPTGDWIYPTQDGSRVFAWVSGGFGAFRASDGVVLWSTGEGPFHERIIATDFGLFLENEDYGVDLRDAQTGEVRRAWSDMLLIRRLAVRNNFAAVAARDVLLLIDLSTGAQVQ
jgi:hypothetical protein